MRGTASLATLLTLVAACSRDEPVQVREAAPAGPAAPAPQPAAVAPSEPERLELADGLVVEVLERGAGPLARLGGEVVVHYSARLEGAEEPFDSSWSRDVPDRWRLSTRAQPRLIEGLVRGLAGLPAGTRCVLHIPAELGYGADGRPPAGIPAGAALVYEVRLLEVGP